LVQLEQPASGLQRDPLPAMKGFLRGKILARQERCCPLLKSFKRAILLKPARNAANIGSDARSRSNFVWAALPAIKHEHWELAQNDFLVREYNRQASVIDDRV
jgi:hypothetical protein